MTHILNSTGGSKDVDDLKYDLEPNDRDKEWLKKEHPLLTLDWLDLIPEPPKNSSQSTRSDLDLKAVPFASFTTLNIDFLIIFIASLYLSNFLKLISPRFCNIFGSIFLPFEAIIEVIVASCSGLVKTKP